MTIDDGLRSQAAAELLRRRRARKSFAVYCLERGYWPSRHHLVIIDALEAVARGECKNLIVVAWPGAAKSTYVSQLFPSWLLSQEHWGGPERRWDILATSHNSDLAQDFSFRVRGHVREEIGIVGCELQSDAVDEWRTSRGDAYRAYGIMAGITGRRFDLGIGDDWVKSSSDADSPTQMAKLWRAYLNDFHARAKPDAAKVIVMTHWSQLDPIGRILPATWNGESGDIEARDGVIWRVVRLAALYDGRPGDPLGRTELEESGWPEWQTTEQFRQIRRTLTEGGEARTWTACYQGVPQPEQGTFFQRKWFQYFDQEPVGCRYIVSSDFAVSDAAKADHIVHGLWAFDSLGKLYLLDVWRRQATLDNDGTDAAIDMVRAAQLRGDLAAWLNEKGVIRKALGGTIRSKMQLRRIYCELVDYPRTADKRTMAANIKSLYAGGRVYHLRNAAWLADYEAELLRFLGGGAEDDQVDMAALVGIHVDKVIAPPQDTSAYAMRPAGQVGDDRLY